MAKKTSKTPQWMIDHLTNCSKLTAETLAEVEEWLRPVKEHRILLEQHEVLHKELVGDHTLRQKLARILEESYRKAALKTHSEVESWAESVVALHEFVHIDDILALTGELKDDDGEYYQFGSSAAVNVAAIKLRKTWAKRSTKGQ